jgi:hypothetical protein
MSQSEILKDIFRKHSGMSIRSNFISSNCRLWDRRGTKHLKKSGIDAGSLVQKTVTKVKKMLHYRTFIMIRQDVCFNKFISGFIDLRCLRTGCWEEYLDQRGIKWQEAGENCIMRSFITCTLLTYLLTYGAELFEITWPKLLTPSLAIHIFHVVAVNCHELN